MRILKLLKIPTSSSKCNRQRNVVTESLFVAADSPVACISGEKRMSTRIRWQATDTLLLMLTLLVPSIAMSSPPKPQDIPPGALTAGSSTNNEPKPLTEIDVINLLKDGVPP